MRQNLFKGRNAIYLIRGGINMENVIEYVSRLDLSGIIAHKNLAIASLVGEERVKDYRFLSSSDEYYIKNNINYKDEYIWREW